MSTELIGKKYRGKLKVEGYQKEYPVSECEYEFKQLVKNNGEPSGRPGGGLIKLSMVAPGDDDTFFHQWMQSATEHKNGKIIFDAEGTTTSKTVSFNHAYCVGLTESFKEEGKEAAYLWLKITLSATHIMFGAAESQDGALNLVKSAVGLAAGALGLESPDNGVVIFKNDQSVFEKDAKAGTDILKDKSLTGFLANQVSKSK